MTYSIREAAVVMFGGAGFCGRDLVPDSALWVWNGHAWSSRSASGPGPGLREDALLLFDDQRDLLFLIGGRRGAEVFADVWKSGSAGWTQSPATDGPGQVEHAAAAFDRSRGRAVIFGGGYRSGASPSRATWEWDGDRWQRAAAAGPAARVGPAMAWTPSLGVLLYGGFADDSVFRDLWQWDGRQWRLLDSNGPAETEGPALVRWGADSLALIGIPRATPGAGIGAWFWNGRGWTAAGVTGPRPRVAPALAYDERRRRVVLFGGADPSTNRPLDDLWEFDGRTWREVPRSR